MRIYVGIGMLAALVAYGARFSASAETCPCDCYFSSDCNSGMYCNWGSLPSEDTCFWRTPKPQGSVGAGCTEVYNNWGQCDGICTPSFNGVHTPFAGFDPAFLTEQLTLLTHDVLSAGMDGGGSLESQVLQEDAVLRQDLLRVVLEIALLMQPEVVTLGPDGPPLISAIDANTAHAIDLGVQALIAEILGQGGSGAPLVGRIAPAILANQTLARICSVDPQACLSQKIADLSALFATEPGRTTAVGGNCNSVDCPADLNHDGLVNAGDLATLLGAWSSLCVGCETDLDGDNVVNSSDLAMLLGAWGACGQI